MTYHILNTNLTYSNEDHEDMLLNGKGSANSVDKLEINKILKGDFVFLYQNGVGFVAFGEADGIVNIENDGNDIGEKHSIYFQPYHLISPPFNREELQNITGIGRQDGRFRNTRFGLDDANGNAIKDLLYKGKRVYTRV